MVIIGFTITLPIFIAGSRIGLALGLSSGSKAFMGGGAILAAIGTLTAYIGSRARLSTYVIAQFCFGRIGARVVNSVVAIALLGWYGVTVDLFARACQTTVRTLFGFDIPVVGLCVLGSALMALTAVWGFKALNYLSTFAVPLMMALLVTAVVAALHLTPWAALQSVHSGEIAVGTAVSLVVGSFVVGAILLPDLCRYARRSWEAMLAAAISLGLVFPTVFYCSMVPSLATGQNDLVLIMIGLGIGVPALVLLIFATWSTNSHNLYSTSLTLASLFPRIAKWKLTILAGVLGTLMASVGILDHFIGFLLFLGTSIPPVAGIYAADFFLLSKRTYTPSELSTRPAWNVPAFVAWALASSVGYASQGQHIELTGITSCDSIITGFVIYWLVALLRRRFSLRSTMTRSAH
jgi:cytosine permease